MHCPDDNDLVAHAEGRLALMRAAEIEEHLDGCRVCCALVADAARRHTLTRNDTRVAAPPVADQAEPSTPLRGEFLGRYRVISVLGRGGMGTVVQAHDPELDRDVAIKVLRRSATALPDGAARLVREARAMAQLSHPNVVGVFEVGDADGRVFVAMELVDGRDLRSWLRVPRQVPEILAVFEQAGRGLAAAHAAGLLHRDFKPDNVFVGHGGPDGPGRVCVGDFGLAQSVTGLPSEPGSDPWASSDSLASGRLTLAGVVLGTPAYMAPEQHADEPIDHRADQFAFCAALYEALWSRRPFVGANCEELAASKLAGPRRPPKQPVVPHAIRRAVLRGLAADPNDRHPDMATLLRAIGNRGRARTRVAVVAAGAVAMVAATVGASQGDPRCTDPARRLAGAWDPQVRARVHAAFVDPARPHTTESAERVGYDLDRWAATWTSTHAQVCTAARDGDRDAAATLDARMACLDDARMRLSALVDVFAGADDIVVLRSIRAVAELPDPARCTEADPIVQDPSVAAARERLAAADALGSAGRYADALALAEPLPDDPTIAADPGLHAEALLLVGRMRQRTSAFEPAEVALTEAYFEAQRTERLDLVADAAIAVLAVVAESHVNPADAEPWTRHAAAAIESAGADPRDRATLHKARGTIALRGGDYPTARRETEAGLALVLEVLGEDHIEVGDYHNNLANVAFLEGRYEDAIELNDRALEIRRDRLGGHHPAVGDSFNNLGAANYNLGRYEESARNHEQALAIWEAAFGRMSADVAASHNNLGGVYHALGRANEAIGHFGESLEIWAQVLDPNHPDVAYAHNNLGNVLQAEGRTEEAARAYERALAIREASLGADHPDVAVTLINLGVVDEAAGRLDRARDEFERALVTLERTLGPDHADVGTTRDNLGLVLRRQGDLDGAVAMHRAALRIHLAALGREHPQTATTEYGLGRALRAKRDPEAIEHLQRAVDGTPTADSKLHAERTATLAATRAELAAG